MKEYLSSLSTTVFLLLLWIPFANASCDIAEQRSWLQQELTIETQIRHDFQQQQLLMERTLAYRQKTLKVARRLKAKLEQKLPLSGADLDALNRGTHAHLELRKALFDAAYRYECWLDENYIQHTAISREQRLTGVMLSLSAALVLYDNYLLALSIFQDDEDLRRIINTSDSGYQIQENTLKEIGYSYHDRDYRARVHHAMEYYRQHVQAIASYKADDKLFTYLQQSIEQSPSYRITFNTDSLSRLGGKLGFLFEAVGDRVESIKDTGVGLLSGIFGNTVGLVETRKGKLYGKKRVAKRLHRKLRAGDILLEKTPFRLTDKLIPGHWGHVAIWSGSPVELKKLGIWDDPAIRPYHAELKHGEMVIEALRTGVGINTLEHFLNVDDVAILRPVELTTQQRRDTLIRAFRQLGKAYDFNFDVETTDKIVCSEIVYTAYTDIQWPTENTLGRYTISPDNVARVASEGKYLKLVSLYLDGKFIRYGSRETFAKLSTVE